MIKHTMLPQQACLAKHQGFKITAITTVRHNVGDDFVREGILYLLEQIMPSCEVSLVHKHIPITTRPEWEWLYTRGITKWFDKLPHCSGLGVTGRLDSLLPIKASTDKVLNCDLLVQCGAPIYWLHNGGSCAQTEWYAPLIRARWCRAKKSPTFINLAGGACQRYDSDGTEFLKSEETLAQIREFYDACRLTTLRDELAQKILRMAGRDACVLPCTSIFARMRLGVEPQPGRYVALNYMPMGGHFLYDPGFKPENWERVFVEFVRKLPKSEKYVLVCHNQKERDAALRLFPAFESFFSEDYRDYINFFSAAKYGIFNRVHAAFALASFGRPSFVIGSDSRAQMVQNLGLRHCHVLHATAEQLLKETQHLSGAYQDYPERIALLHERTKRAYLDLLQPVLG